MKRSYETQISCETQIPNEKYKKVPRRSMRIWGKDHPTLQFIDELLHVTRRIRERLESTTYDKFVGRFSEGVQTYLPDDKVIYKYGHDGFHIGKEPNFHVASTRGIWLCAHPPRHTDTTVYFSNSLEGQRLYYNIIRGVPENFDDSTLCVHVAPLASQGSVDIAPQEPLDSSLGVSPAVSQQQSKGWFSWIWK